MAALGDLEVEMEGGDRRMGVADLGPPLALRRRLRDRERRGLPARGNVVEEGAGPAECVGRIDVARDREEGVAGGVPRLVEGSGVVEGSGGEVVHGPDDGVLVSERVPGERVGRLERRRVGLVVDAQPLFFLHGLALVVELLLREDEGAHPVGLEEEPEVEALGRQRLVVVRPILGGRAVHRAAGLGDEPEVLALADVLRPLEHEVLEKVGEARFAGGLDAAPDVVRDVHGHEGDPPLGRHDDGEAVRQALDVVRDFEIEGNGRPPGSRPWAGPVIYPAVLNVFRLAGLAALALALQAAAAAAEDPPKDDAGLPKFRFEAVLHDYEPLEDRSTRFAELFWAGVTADWTRGAVSARAQVRGTEGLFRPFYAGSVWLEEGWAALKTPAGMVRAGKVVPEIGLADETFSGTLFSYNGVTRNPGWGAQLAGEAPFGPDALAWSAAWIEQNDRVGWEEDGRDVESDADAGAAGTDCRRASRTS